MANKVLYNFKNVHYALVSVDAQGVLSFSTPKRLLGTVDFSMELEQSSEPIYSEGLVYHVLQSTSGYKGELTLHNISEDFEAEVLGLKKDSKNVMYEDLNIHPKEFALLFEISGDAKAVRHVMYRIQASKPKLEYKTTTDKADITNVKLNYVGLADENGIGRVKTNDDTDTDTYANWFKNVYKVTKTAE